MRIIIASDSHNIAKNLAFLAKKNFNSDRLLFLGDGENDINSVLRKTPTLPVSAVRGNCDFASELPVDRLIRLGGKLVFMAHGHTYYVKGGLEQFLSAAKGTGADIALFGHTHLPLISTVDGILVLNPGTISGIHTGKCTFGVIQTDQKGNLVPSIHEVKN